ncbi:MAG: Holliday junction branch migration protein RuvA, partial [Bryobacteraceae bacterium]
LGPAGMDAASPSALGTVEQDVLSALLNLGCGRAAAESAVRKAKAAGGEPGFDELFRRALELAR